MWDMCVKKTNALYAAAHLRSGFLRSRHEVRDMFHMTTGESTDTQSLADVGAGI